MRRRRGYRGRRSAAGPRWRSAVPLCGLLLALPGHAWALPPVTGELQYTGRYARADDSGPSRSSESHVGTLRLDTSMPIWEPWLAHLRANVGLSVTETETRRGGEEPSSSTGRLRTGELELNVLPSSRFPLRIWADRRDSRLNDDVQLIGVLGVDRSVTRYGLQQQYTSDAGARYVFRIEETVVKEEAEEDRRDERLNWSLNASQRWTEHDLAVDLRQDQTREGLTGRSTDRDLLAARHRYTPQDRNYTLNNLVSLTRRDTATPLSGSRFTQNQVTSTGFWRSPGARPLQVTGNLRVMESRSDFGEDETTDQLADLSVGASYQRDEHWRFDATSGVSLRDRDDGNELSHRHSASARYSSTRRPLGGFEYRWDADSRVGYRGGDETEDSAEIGVGLGHTLDRDLADGRYGRLRATLQQAASQTWSSTDNDRADLTHGAFLYWDHSAGEVNAFGQLQATDARQFNPNDPDRVFQLVNLQLSVQQQLTREQSISGNASFQASRSGETGDMSDWQPSTSLGLVYNHRQLFGVPRLRLRSDLRYTSDDVLGLLRPEDRLEAAENLRWENRFDYTIGLLDLSLLLALTETGDASNQLYLFRLTRRFGQ